MIEVLDHGLYRPHHKGETDKHQRDPHADRRKADLKWQPATDPAILGVDRGQRNPGNRGR